MPQTDDLPEGAREFRALLGVMQWDTLAFARAARIKARSAAAMWRGEREVPHPLMTWLRAVVACATQLPPPPPTEP